MFSIFGVLALGLAAIGIYGVKAYAVARRTREIGIRMALGAERKTVLWMILREGLVMVTGGLVLGLLLAFATGNIVSSILFDVSSTDPIAFISASVTLAVAALIADLDSGRVVQRGSNRWRHCAPNEKRDVWEH